MKKIIIFLGILSSTSVLMADCESVLENNIGWTIIDSKTIDGYRDPGEEKKDDFEGCDYNRIIFFNDGTAVRCNSYGYQYAYNPTAIILGRTLNYKGKTYTLYKMIVEGEEYDLAN